MSTFYQKQGVSSCEIAGAVALAALHDLRVNLFTFSGFPQVSVSEAPNDQFTITLSWADREGKTSSVAFELAEKVAFSAAKRFKKEVTHDVNIFEPVQKALAELEGKSAR
jgi:hypothetical protein